MPVDQVNRNRQQATRHGNGFALTALLPALTLPALAAAQSSPFLTGATALQNNILAWLTPIAVILIMILGAMAMASRLSWGWCLGVRFSSR